ncbi:hypothetical protein MRY82_10410 [bacterium]|nr:hypothetical protein [bacterium]
MNEHSQKPYTDNNDEEDQLPNEKPGIVDEQQRENLGNSKTDKEIEKRKGYAPRDRC